MQETCEFYSCEVYDLRRPSGDLLKGLSYDF